MRTTLLSLLLAAVTFAQTVPVVHKVTVDLRPVPAKVTQKLYGTRDMYAWTVRVCNDEATEQTWSADRIVVGVPDVAIFDTNTALQMLNLSREARWQLSTSTWVELGISVATAFIGAGVITASGKVVAALATSGPVAHRVGDMFRERYPAFDSRQLLDGPLTIPAMMCERRTAFAGKTKGAKAVTVTISRTQ